MPRYAPAIVVPCFLWLGACVNSIPQMNLMEGSPQAYIDEENLVQLIKCEVGTGAEEALHQPALQNSPFARTSAEWLRNLSANVSLKITVDEKSSVNVGGSYNDYRPAVTQFNYSVQESFKLGLGVQASSQATAIETTGFSFPVATLMSLYARAQAEHVPCNQLAGGKPIVSELGIPDFLRRKALLAASAGLIGDDSASYPYTTFVYEASFIVTYGGSINPLWTLVQLTAIAPGPLYNLVRTKTHNVTITFGPIDSPQTAAVANANLVGQAVASALERRP